MTCQRHARDNDVTNCSLMRLKKRLELCIGPQAQPDWRRSSMETVARISHERAPDEDEYALVRVAGGYAQPVRLAPAGAR